MHLSIGAIVSCLLIQGLCQFVPFPSDLKETKGFAGYNVRWKEVPTGICELDPKVKSYAGYVDVADDKHIHFVFYEARNVDPKKAPLTSWINGGPGSSSEIGQFQELGPCGVDSNGNVFNNPYSWSDKSNLIFIDQPAQVGFSYSIPVPGVLNASTGEVQVLQNGVCPATDDGSCGTFSNPNVNDTETTTAAVAPAFWATLQGFMGAFPKYSRESFNFATESYGGHYGPVINEYLESQNAKDIPGAHKINLKTVLIGNGWYDPIIQYQAYYNFTVSPGNTYDYSPFTSNQSAQMYNNLYGQGNCVDQLRSCAASGDNTVCSNGDSYCANNVESLYDEYLGRDEYDIRYLVPDPFPYNFYVAYLNTPKVLSAFGAATNYSDYSAAVSNAFATTGDDGREDGTIEDIALLLKQGVTVTLYAGDADYNCNWLGGEVISNEIGAPGFNEAGYVDLITSDGIVHGQVRQSASFSFVRVYESGHEVPFYQPVAALAILERAIHGLDIATGTQKANRGYKTFGPPKSTYREGNGTIQFSIVNANATYNATYDHPNPMISKTSFHQQRPVKGADHRRITRASRKMKDRMLMKRG